ncbi:MAG: ROK family transcriptional regulator [Lachnospiraceae bacterium]|nr:ROK family transcriptional regulator [Lachnospiraceae bacterium]
MNLLNLNNSEREVFHVLQKRGPLTKHEILAVCDIRPSNLNRIIAYLLNEGMIVEEGQDISSGGRKPSIFDIRKDHSYIIGVQMSHLSIKVVLTDLKMQILQNEERLRTPDCAWDGETVMASVLDFAYRALKKSGISEERLLCIGVGVSGTVDYRTGIIGPADHVSFLDWPHLNVKSELEEHFRCPVYVDLGANAVAIGEYLYGSGQNCTSLAVLGYSAALSSAFISNGKLVRSATNSENHFAHTVINVAGEQCACGNRGCLQTYASISVVVREVMRRIALGENCSLDVNNFDMDTYRFISILQAAYAGDKVCTEEIKKSAYFYGIGLSNYVSLLSPEIVVLTGPFVGYDELYFETAVNIAKNILAKKGITKTCFQKYTHLGKEKGSLAISAAALAFECYMNSPIVSR